MRQVVLDTETTGLDPLDGHRIIEVGCVEIIDRKVTGRVFHHYVNPEREIDAAAIEVHGITNEKLADKPLFSAIAADLHEFVAGAELVIHNAAFDMGFLNNEYGLVGGYTPLESCCGVLDTLLLARKLHPGQKNNLDALCKRYGIDNSGRDFHGALLDARILADVYLAMTGGQTALGFHSGDEGASRSGELPGSTVRRLGPGRPSLKVIAATPEDLEAHEKRLQRIDKESGGKTLWKQLTEPV